MVKKRLCYDRKLLSLMQYVDFSFKNIRKLAETITESVPAYKTGLKTYVFLSGYER